MKQQSGYAEKVAKIRTRLLKDFNGVCFYCGKKLTKATVTIDHFIPLSKGGAHTYGNYRPACKECNQKKGDLLLDAVEIKETPTPLRIEMLKDRVNLISQIKKLESASELKDKRLQEMNTANIALVEELHRERIKLRKALKFLVHYRTIIQVVVKRFNKRNLEDLIRAI